MTIFQDGRIGDYMAQRNGQGARRTNVMIPRLQVSAAASTAVSLTELKAYLKIDGDDQDAELTALLGAVESLVESWTGRALVTRAIVAWFDMAPDVNFIELPYAPVSAVSGFASFAPDDTETAFTTASYFADTVGEPGRVVLKSTATWPTNLRNANALKISYSAGYATASDVPAGLKLAIKLLCAHFHEGKGAQMLDNQFSSLADAPPAVALSLGPWNILRLGD